MAPGTVPLHSHTIIRLIHQAYVCVCKLFQLLTCNTLFQVAMAMNRMDTQTNTFMSILFMISSVFPLVDIFCMQTSWATHVINIMALNNCDQNSCDVGLHNPEHFLYVSYAPNNDNKNIEIIENISVHDSRYSTLQTVPAVRVSVVSSSQ